MCGIVFCASYLAVHVVVTHPAGRDARGVSTLELAGAAGGRRALYLVRAVATVVLAVTHKVTGDAATAGARELVWSAGDVTWRTAETIVRMCEA